MLDFVIFAVTFLVALIIAIIWLYPGSQKVTTVPGLDPTSKEDGNLSDIGRAGSIHEFLLDLHKQFGSIAGFWWGQTYAVSIASPELFKEHQNVFDKPADFYETFRPMYGSASITYANGSDGRSRRRNHEKAFTSEVLSKHSSSFQKVANSIAKKWMTFGQEDHVPLTEHTCNYAFKSILSALFGEDFENDGLISKMKAAYEKAWLEIERHALDSFMPGEDSPQGKKVRQALDNIHSVIKEVIAAHKKRGVKAQEGKLIDILIEVSQDETTQLNDAVTYISQGLESSMNVLSWALYFLATHKDAQDKLRKEIIKILGAKGTINESNLVKFKYLFQVIDETLRCAVVSPWTARVQDFDSELGGHKIPKNTPVIHALGVVMQDEGIWSEPNKFDPDRFKEASGTDKVSLNFPAFGFAGKRKCPGHMFAYWQASIFIATLIHRFELSLWSDQVVQPVYGLFTRPEEEIWIKVAHRPDVNESSI